MTLYTIQIRTAGISSSPTELVCTYDDLAQITCILDEAKPYRVFEYKISSGGCVYSSNHFPFFCKKLVTKFDWNKGYIPPPFEFEDDETLEELAQEDPTDPS